MYTLETSNMKKICLFSSIFIVRARRVVKRLNKLDHAVHMNCKLRVKKCKEIR